jgi:hypothetical protein
MGERSFSRGLPVLESRDSLRESQRFARRDAFQLQRRYPVLPPRRYWMIIPWIQPSRATVVECAADSKSANSLTNLAKTT